MNVFSIEEFVCLYCADAPKERAKRDSTEDLIVSARVIADKVINSTSPNNQTITIVSDLDVERFRSCLFRLNYRGKLPSNEEQPTIHKAVEIFWLLETQETSDETEASDTQVAS